MDIIKFGKRYRCYNCGALFYDLNKEVAICPKCGINQANAPKPEQRLQQLAEEIRPEAEEIAGLEEDIEGKDTEAGEEEEFVDFNEEESEK